MRRLLMTLFAMIWATSAAATVTYDDTTHSLTIQGRTTAAMLTQVRSVFVEHDVDTVFMRGPGGSFTSGLEIGRLIRQEGVRVIIPRGSHCASACAFAALAADGVIMDGALMFHSPYAIRVPTSATVEEIGGMYGDAYLVMAEYLIEMGHDIALARHIVANTDRCTFLVADADHPLDDMVVSDRCQVAQVTPTPASGAS